MNGYELSAQWFAFADENPEKVDPTTTALYFAVMQRCNEVKWRPKFQLPTLDTMQRLGIKSPKTYYAALDQLVEWGFVRLLERAKNQYTACIIEMVAHVSAEAIFTEALTEADQKHVVSTPPAHAEARETYINNKTIKQKKQINENTPVLPVLTESVKFDEFYDGYGKKTGRKAAETEWRKLSEQDRKNAIAAIQNYIAYQPDPKFRKDPERYLKHRVWESEFPVIGKQSAIPMPGSDAPTYQDLMKPEFKNPVPQKIYFQLSEPAVC